MRILTGSATIFLSWLLIKDRAGTDSRLFFENGASQNDCDFNNLGLCAWRGACDFRGGVVMSDIIKKHGYEVTFLPAKKGGRDAILSVSRRDKDGRAIVGADAVAWWEAIRTAIDANEQAALCRAIYRS